HYLSKGYPEAQVRVDFINPLFKALGWDIENKAQKPPHERDVIVELSPETTGRPDYNFRINGATKFFVEAKAPSVALDDVNHILQAKSYAWSTKEVYFVVLTDFEEFRLYDASLKPNPRFPDEGLVFNFKFTEYLNNLEKLWELSRERVEQGSLESLLPRDVKSKRLRIPPDKSFLEELTIWRTELAKDVHKRNPQFDIRLLNDVVQKLLDRIIFIRIAEDRRTRRENELKEIVELWKEEGKRKPIMTHLKDIFHEVNDDLNGDIFKYHACEKADVDSELLAEIIENLYFPKSRYRFDAIGVELLGSIYERYLGSTIRVTPQRVKVEEKPEVRKAGGVYYTPKYIVDYIVKNTVGKVIEGKTPRQIEKIKILDPACGSGSFLIGAYQCLIDYHLEYYRNHPKEAQTQFFDFYYKVSPEDLALPLRTKAAILRNNIFGVDIDPQAVEITIMSLYLKALEGERGLLPKKQHLLPPLSNNIKCGNSLIGYDIFDNSSRPPLKLRGGEGGVMLSGSEWDDETKSRINPFDWNSKSAGFGEILNPPQSPLNKGGSKGGFDVVIGNPPYVFTRDKGFSELEKNYFKKFKHSNYQLNTFTLFTEQGFNLLKRNGYLGYIIPNNWLTISTMKPFRDFIVGSTGELVITNNLFKVFQDANVDTSILVFRKAKPTYIYLTESTEPSKIDIIAKAIPSDVLSEPTIQYRLYKNREVKSLLKKVETNSIQLGEITLVKAGLKAYETGKGKPKQTDAMKKNRIYHSRKKLDSSYRIYLDGQDVRRYATTWSGEYLKYGQNLAAPRDSELFKGERILVRQIPSRPPYSINATIVFGDELNDINSMVVKKTSAYSLKYILGIINSKLLTIWFDFKFEKFQRAIFPQFKVNELATFPIRPIDFNNPSEKAIHDKLVSLVDRMLDLHKKKNSLPPSAEREKIEREIAVTDERIDKIVYGLYEVTEEEEEMIEKG
ncbi:MAG: hypothetical protein FJ242_08995, partial [Nitrospira sp.]|nr:hypothetical protein [Nitrospira sp.]